MTGDKQVYWTVYLAETLVQVSRSFDHEDALTEARATLGTFAASGYPLSREFMAEYASEAKRKIKQGKGEA